MFPLFFDLFNHPQQARFVVRLKSPNGAWYNFMTNTMDQKTLDGYKEKLNEAIKRNDQKEFDRVWNEMTKINEKEELTMLSKLYSMYKAFDQDYLRFPEFKINTWEIVINERIDENKLKRLKNKQEEENKKMHIQERIKELKQKLDEKLLEFAKHLDDEEMKKKLSDELTEINKEIKTLEKEL